MRPFIHKAEDKLDKLLYAEMKRLAKAAMKAKGKDVVFDDEKTGWSFACSPQFANYNFEVE